MRSLLKACLTAGLVAALLGAAEAQVESPSDRFGSDPQAPLSDQDPFAVLKQRAADAGSIGREPNGEARIKTEGSVFLRSVRTGLNQDARVNPDNRLLRLTESDDVLETRFTASGTIDTSKQWRWLFKGYALVPNDRVTAGPLRDKSRVDELFVDGKGEQWFASLGKRRINWGHAQAFNPVNVVVPLRDPLDPGRATEGQPMLWVNRTSGAQSLDLVATRNYNPAAASDQNRWGIKWGVAGLKSDYALYYFDGEPYRDGRRYERMLGGSFSANLFDGITSYMEAGRFEKNYRNYYAASGEPSAKDGAYTQFVAGSTLSLGGKRRATLEYFRNNQGYSASERENYFRAVEARIASGADAPIAREYRVTGMNRDYLLARYQDEIRERYTLDLNALLARDRSYSLRAQVAYAITDYYEFRVVMMRNRGTRDSEFGNNPVSSALQLWFGANF